jgi:GTP:adenosylcobinamide-phosphate guanylyltransferase
MTAKIESAMVMAAGLGKRMRPLTATRPKPLVRVAGKALIDHSLDRIEAAGVGRVVVNVHYLADALEAHLAAQKRAFTIAISDERDLLLETGGGMMKALPQLTGDPILIVNSDNIWTDGPQDSIRQLARHWDGERMDALLLVISTWTRMAACRGGSRGGSRRSSIPGSSWCRGGCSSSRPRGPFRPMSSGTARSRPSACTACRIWANGSTSAPRRASRRPKPR